MYYDSVMFSFQKSDEPRPVRVIGIDSRPNGTKCIPKKRDCAVIHYVLQGAGYFDHIRITAGQGFYFPSNTMHTYEADPNNPWCYVFMDLTQDFADRYVAPLLDADSNGIFAFSFTDQLQRWADQTFSENGQTLVSHVDAIYHATSILRRHRAPSDAQSSKQEFYIQKAKLYIENNLNHQLTVVDVSRAVNLNERYLCSLFVKYEGMSTKDYIISRKIRIARDLLAGSALSVKEIALSIGFSDANSFSKTFKLKTGHSPSEYRETHKTGSSEPGISE